MIQLTPAAISEIYRIQRSRQQPDSHFRIAIAPGGCSGHCYTFGLCAAPNEGDRLWNIQEVSIAIDPSDATYLKNLRLDYAEDLMGGGFRFENPNVTSPCSCGLSFALIPN